MSDGRPRSRRSQRRSDRAIRRFLDENGARKGWSPERTRRAAERYERDMKRIKRSEERRESAGCAVTAVTVVGAAVTALATWRGWA